MGKAGSNVTHVGLHSGKYFRRLSNYTNEEIHYRLKNYFKFFFVRHPIERLISAYRNKFEDGNRLSYGFPYMFGRQIIKRYRPNATKESLAKGQDVTFKEFVHYIIDLPLSPQRTTFNEHWCPMNDLCHPCAINYDVIGKYERFKSDTRLVLSMANLTQLDDEFPPSTSKVNTRDVMEEYTNQLSREELARLYHIYALDFELFDYVLHFL